jgi:hypothetical protein
MTVADFVVGTRPFGAYMRGGSLCAVDASQKRILAEAAVIAKDVADTATGGKSGAGTAQGEEQSAEDVVRRVVVDVVAAVVGTATGTAVAPPGAPA